MRKEWHPCRVSSAASIREDLGRHLQMHGIIMPGQARLGAPTEQIAERFLQVLDRLVMATGTD